MKIIEIYIQNFGKLSDFNLKLNDGLNQIVEENGFGKTTLMTFIKAMFYGFNKKTERQKFAPWNKGIYGGYIIFEKDSITYRLERTFGLRNALDETRLFNTQTMQEIALENIGDHFFELDESTFTRLLYVDENMLSAQTTSVLIGKLTKLTQNQQTVISSYDSAMEILDEKRAYLQKQNGKGAIPEKNAEILNLNRELENANKNLELSEKYAQEIKDLKEKEIDLKQKLIFLEKQIDEATKQEANKQNQKQLTFLLNEKQRLENEQARIFALFPLGFPSEDSINSYANKLSELNNLNALLLDQENLNQNQAEMENQNLDLDAFKQNKTIALSLISKQHKPTKKQLSKPSLICFSLSSLSLIALILGLIINKNIISIIFGVILLISIFLGVIFYLKQPKSQNENKTLSQLNNLFPSQNFASINDALEKINQIEINLSLKAQSSEKIKDLKQNIARLENELNAFNENFNLKSNSYQNALDEIKTHMFSYENLTQEKNKTMLQISNFETINQNITATNLDLNTLKNQRTSLQNQLDQTKNETLEKENRKIIADNSCDRIDEISTSLNNAKEVLNELTNQLNIVKLTKQYLEDAKIALSSKYITPTQNNLNNLASTFENTKKYMPLHLKDDLSLMFEENNTLRDSSNLSTGLKHTFAILTRIALINTIFDSSPMPLFLDDPFQALDAENLKNMQEVLNELTKSNQIIYLTCSNERKF